MPRDSHSQRLSHLQADKAGDVLAGTHLLPPAPEGSTLDTWSPPAPYTNPSIHMSDANDSNINDLYKRDQLSKRKGCKYRRDLHTWP